MAGIFPDIPHTLCGQNVELWSVKPRGGRRSNRWFQRVKHNAFTVQGTGCIFHLVRRVSGELLSTNIGRPTKQCPVLMRRLGFFSRSGRTGTDKQSAHYEFDPHLLHSAWSLY